MDEQLWLSETVSPGPFRLGMIFRIPHSLYTREPLEESLLPL